MEITVFEAGKAVGRLELNRDGLYWHIRCSMDRPGELRRIYAMEGFSTEYLGIPDGEGHFMLRLPVKRLREPECALASPEPRGQWQPWRGKVDGVLLEDCLLRRDSQGIHLALPEQELLKLPAWADRVHREQVNGREWALLELDPEGNLPQIERDNGGREYETDDYSGIDPLLLADLPSDYGYGIEDKQQKAGGPDF